SVVVVVRYFSTEGSVEHLDLGDAHCPPAVSARLENGLFGIFIVFVFNFTDDLFEYVFHRDQPCSAAMLVNHDRKMVTAASEIAQKNAQFLGFRDEDGGAYERPQIQLGIGDG